jgi:glycosyltransferase involved in cell wall biosynthesis
MAHRWLRNPRMRNLSTSVGRSSSSFSNSDNPVRKGKLQPADPGEIPLIAICHLSWKWVWQRPQQFLSRLSKLHPLLFVETYCTETPAAYLNESHPASHPRVTILEMHLPASRWADGDFIDGERRGLMKRYLASESGRRFQNAILWFNDPMAVTAFAGNLGERMIVYDCMDELTQFKGAPPALAERERELTQLADVIFCGGRAMRDKRLPLNPNCHFYGTGVDCEHFSKASDPETQSHPLMAGFDKPVLGYFGVIDERIDYELLAAMAAAHPEWNLVMVGPFAKIDPEKLPKHPNLHWLGSQSYDDLPALTKDMDLCLMPFALNEATEYINPTKALEYMAAGKAVISTGIQEVRTNFHRVCHIAESHDHFIELCENELARPSVSRISNGLRQSSENTWEAIAAKMEGHMQDVLIQRTAPASGESSSALNAPAYV